MKAVGDYCSIVIVGVTQEQINRFGDVHGTDGRTHTDPEFARTSVFKGVIVQGALVLAPVLEALSCIYGEKRWWERGVVETKFTSFTRPQDEVEVTFTVEESGQKQLRISYVCKKNDGTIVQTGIAIA